MVIRYFSEFHKTTDNERNDIETYLVNNLFWSYAYENLFISIILPPLTPLRDLACDLAKWWYFVWYTVCMIYTVSTMVVHWLFSIHYKDPSSISGDRQFVTNWIFMKTYNWIHLNMIWYMDIYQNLPIYSFWNWFRFFPWIESVLIINNYN